MPKKFSKVGGKIVLENTRRTIPKVVDSESESFRFESYLQEKYGRGLDIPEDGSSPLSNLDPINVGEELDILYDVMKDQIIEDLKVEETDDELVSLAESYHEYDEEVNIPEVKEVVTPDPMERYTAALKPTAQEVAEQDIQNSPATLADLRNIETTLRNVQTSLTTLGGGGLGERDVISLVNEYAPEVILDSAHLDYLASKLDSDFKFTDSDEVVAIIHYTVDSAYVQARADIEGTVDSAYVQQRVTIPDAILKSGDDSDRTFAMNKGLFMQSNNLSPQDALTLTYDGAPALKIEKDGSLKINKTDFLDSNEVPNVGWVLKNSGDSAETIALIEEYRDSSWFTSELTKNDLGTLNDVDIPAPLQKDFLMWNGAQWVSHQQFADTGFHYKGDVDATAVNSVPANISHGDMWTNNTVGIADSSWVGLGGSGVAVGDMLVYDSNHVPPEWDNFGHLGGGGGVSAIYEGFGIDVDNTTPANPVVSLDTVQADDRYLQRTGGTMEGSVTFTDGNNLVMQNTAEVRTNTLNGTGDLAIKRNGNDRIKLTSSNTLISGQPIRYDGIDDTKITQDGHLITKSYASDNFITSKGGIITHTASSPDPNHAFRIIFSNTSVPSGASAVEVDLSKKETIGYRVEANPAAAGEFHTGVYAHQKSFPEVYANTGNKLIGFKYEAENGGLQNITIDAKFKTIHSLETKGTLLRSEVDGDERFNITHDGGITVLNPGGGGILNFDVTTEALTVEGDITSQGTLNAPSLATDNIVTNSITSNSSLTVNGNITTTGTITTTGNITANKVTSNSDIQVQNPNALKTNHIKSIGDSNIQIYRKDDVKMMWGSSKTQSHQPIEYQASASSSIGADGRTRDLIDINYAETHIAGKTRVVNSLPSTLERGVLYFTSGNVLTVGV